MFYYIFIKILTYLSRSYLPNFLIDRNFNACIIHLIFFLSILSIIQFLFFFLSFYFKLYFLLSEILLFLSSAREFTLMRRLWTYLSPLLIFSMCLSVYLAELIMRVKCTYILRFFFFTFFFIYYLLFTIFYFVFITFFFLVVILYFYTSFIIYLFLINIIIFWFFTFFIFLSSSSYFHLDQPLRAFYLSFIFNSIPLY